MLTFHAIGNWGHEAVSAAWAESSRRIVPEVERLIDASWEAANRRPGVQLFDGPMCRMESWKQSADRLELTLSLGSYRPFLGTNLERPELADRHGREILANPVGVSPALVTADGYLMMGRRNGSVAYYPNRVHPFAGALEPRDALDVFGAVERELAEELHLTAADIADIRCMGIAEDRSIRQPELIFRVHSKRSRREIDAQVDAKEHHASWTIAAKREAVEEVLATSGASAGPDALTPVGVAALLLWGRGEFGDAWFAQWQARME